MDVTLHPFLQAQESAERERWLDELILVCAAPIVRAALRRHLRFHLNADGASANNPDAEDLYQEILSRLIKRLNDLRVGAGGSEIRDFRQYVARVAANSCHDYLRLKYPARARLKDKLRDLLERHADFAIWGDEEGGQRCGFAVRGREKLTAPQGARAALLEADPGALVAVSDGPRMPLGRLVAEVFNYVDGPVELESLVNIASALIDLQEQSVTSLEEASEGRVRWAEQAVICESVFEAREIFLTLWEAMGALTVRQRTVFFLGFADERGDDLLSLLLGLGAAEFDEIHEALELTAPELVAIWPRMPMEQSEIATLLGVSRSQISKWRARALQQLGAEIFAVARRR